MITPSEIKLKAERRYLHFLTCWLRHDAFFPYEIPVGKQPSDFKQLHDAVEMLLKSSKKQCGYGYSIILEQRQTQRYGIQSIPRKIVFENEDDFLQFLRKKSEFLRFKHNVTLIQDSIPQLEDWMLKNIQKIIDNDQNWEKLLRVCHYFLNHPNLKLYLRELPIQIHTKFIEANQQILRSLLDFLLPDLIVDSSTTSLERRFGLKYDEPLIRFRILDDSLQSIFQFTDFSIPLSQAVNLEFSSYTMIIAENKMNFLTIPAYPHGIAVFGEGFKVDLIRRYLRLQNCRILYWGDLDSYGFQILALVREYFPHTESIMMDQETLEAFKDYCVTAPPFTSSAPFPLTIDEQAVFEYLLFHNLRLEQEHISQAYVLQRFQGLSALDKHS